MEEQKPNEQNSFNPFTSAETPSPSYAGHTPSNPSDFTGQAHSAPAWDAPAGASVNEASPKQAQFPRFNNPKLDPSGVGADAADIKKRMEDAKSNGWGAQLVGIFTAHKARIAIVLAVVAMFAIGAYTTQFNAPSDRTSASIAAVSSQGGQDTNDAAVFDITLDNAGTVILESAGGNNRLLVGAQDGSSITKTASPGEGITHLARHALVDYLQDIGKSLSAEQKIYAEDYVQNMTGDEWLEIGQKLSFSQSLLADAVRTAEGLEDWQIENLKQYTVTPVQ